LLLYLYSAVSLALALAYFLLIRFYTRHWNALPQWEIPDDYIPASTISVIIAARNESLPIEACLRSVLQQNYPADLFEVIVVDDYSEDDTAAKVAAFKAPNLHLVRLADCDPDPGIRAFKKKAIETGINRAKGELIVVTDADCIVQPDWLRLIASLYERKKAILIAAPVEFHLENNAITRFQSLDLLGMMAITGAGIHTRTMRMCNGANLAYSRKAFLEAGGFSGLDGIASGDDMLLAQKMALTHADRIFYLKNKAAAVFTEAKPDWKSFFNQRLRWASKSAHYIEWRVTAALGIVYVFCMNILFSLVMSVWYPLLIPVFLIPLALKAIIDYYFLKNISSWFNRGELLYRFLPSFFLHCWYIICVGTASMVVKKYEWKGRKVR
jgi:cellulose synthase/poly-beta-1,6-N-acetylglucosamine synthase-like glycosyltransferase